MSIVSVLCRPSARSLNRSLNRNADGTAGGIERRYVTLRSIGMSLFTKKEEPAQENVESKAAQPTSGKGRPTPKRKDAQAQNLRPLVPKDRDASRKAAKARIRERENAEYDAAKNEQAELEEKILKLETMIRNAKVIDESEITSDRVNLGHTVRVEYIGAGEVEEYTIVGSNESDPFEGRISNESAIGSALIGTSVNDEVTVEIPDGIIHLKVLEISRH